MINFISSSSALGITLDRLTDWCLAAARLLEVLSGVSYVRCCIGSNEFLSITELVLRENALFRPTGALLPATGDLMSLKEACAK